MDRMYKEEWLPRMRSVESSSCHEDDNELLISSTYCHILQYNEDEIKSLDDVGAPVERIAKRQLCSHPGCLRY